MPKGTVLITGATGFLGSAVLIELLRSGYSAHIVVRSEQKAESLKSAPAMLAVGRAEACKYFVVPDLTVAGCLDEAADGADRIFHLASPLPFGAMEPERFHDGFVVPAVNCTLSVLESARKVGTVKRVVCISSSGAFATPELLGPTWIPPETVYISEANLNNYLEPPYSDMMTAYCAAKTASLRRSMEWLAEAGDSASFDLVNLAPGYVCGPQPLAQSTSELLTTSNAMFLRSAIATDPPEGDRPLELAGGICLSDFLDIALTSLDKDKLQTPSSGPSKGVETYAIGKCLVWNDINGIVAKLWPEEVKNGLLPNRGDFPTKPRVSADLSKMERDFHIKLKGLEDMLKGIIPQYLELLKKEKA
ncbi:hypothetical protein BX600DRAFT_527334 [Xylariales sp. PMI_506]|nr:hypothetical protein BX600DRAFT_527334 [Xylariales sp. PMI_506]